MLVKHSDYHYAITQMQVILNIHPSSSLRNNGDGKILEVVFYFFSDYFNKAKKLCWKCENVQTEKGFVGNG